MMSPSVPAGWYDDPDEPGWQRYWDGDDWTEHTAPNHAPPPPEPSDEGSLEDVLKVGCGLLLAIAIAVFVVWSMMSGDSESEDSTGSDEKFEQTWAKDYGDTTCKDWKGEMTQKQQFVAAADMLITAQKLDDGNSLPKDSLVKEFQQGITTACFEPGQKITGISALLYTTERARFSP